jgi:predicted hotdog family 3-hydroxylacyl-ACP dehydratase
VLDLASLNILDIIPHKPPMALIDKVIDFTQDSVTASVTITGKSLFFENGAVPSYVGIEYMAQAVAAWNGLMARQNNLPGGIGYLLGTRKMKLLIENFKEGSHLEIKGHCKFTDGEIASFDCSIHLDGTEVTSAALTVFQPKNQEIL